MFHYFGEIDPLLWINRQHTSNYFYIIIDHSYTNTSTTQTSLLQIKKVEMTTLDILIQFVHTIALKWNLVIHHKYLVPFQSPLCTKLRQGSIYHWKNPHNHLYFKGFQGQDMQGFHIDQ